MIDRYPLLSHNANARPRQSLGKSPISISIGVERQRFRKNWLSRFLSGFSVKIFIMGEFFTRIIILCSYNFLILFFWHLILGFSADIHVPSYTSSFFSPTEEYRSYYFPSICPFFLIDRMHTMCRYHFYHAASGASCQRLGCGLPPFFRSTLYMRCYYVTV